MASSSHEAIPVPVKLPAPPSIPLKSCDDFVGHNEEFHSVVARTHVALEDNGGVPSSSSLDAHIRWVVESGSIVRKGEKIAKLFYSFHGSPPPPPSRSSAIGGASIIRARPRKKRWSSTLLSSDNSNKTQASNDQSQLPKGNTFVTIELQSPSNGFLRILYTKLIAVNAVYFDNRETLSPTFSVKNLNLAAIEPCEHPAVVGVLCAVCGADVREPKVLTPVLTEANPQKHRVKTANMQNKEANMSSVRKSTDARQQQIIIKQKKLAASLTSSKEFGNDNDKDLANLDIDAVITGYVKASQPSSPNGAKQSAPAPKPKKATVAPSSSRRSLSSFLSGVKETQKMQQILPKQSHPPQQRHSGTWRPMQKVMSPSMYSSLSSNTAGDDDGMTKVTVSGGITINISETEAKSISEASSKKLREEKKLCLVLDLDHTLLHATDDYRAGKYVADEVYVGSTFGNEKDQCDGNGTSHMEQKNNGTTRLNPDFRDDVRSILLPVELPPVQQQQYVQQKLEQQKQEETNFCLSPIPEQKKNASSIIMRHFIKLRPHLKEFLSQIKSTYQLSIYTAGTRSYAEQVAVMICRHLVGASLDEEGLNTLRAKVREKEAEYNNYREYKSREGRKRQLNLAREWESKDEAAGNKGNGKTMGGKEQGSKKFVSFEIEKLERAPKQSFNPKKNVADGSTLDSSAICNGYANGEIFKSGIEISDGECVQAPASSLGKRGRLPVGEGDTNIPRKKKPAKTDSLLNLIPKTESTGKRQDHPPGDDKLLEDPSKERDKLLLELEAAEKREIEAVELRRKMFGSRIVSRTDVGDLGKDVKSLKRVFPCGGVMAAILDDREDVWANAKNNATGRPGEPPDNLLLVKPYHWKPFIGFADINNASGHDFSKKDGPQRLTNGNVTEKDDDAQLLWTADILRRLHERYYSPTLSQEERDGMTVPGLLQSMRKETLLRFPKAKVAFSGLIPINRQNKQTQIRPYVVRYAEELGAEVLPGVSPDVTHVIAARDGSEKIKQARREVPGCYVVHTSWLMECYWSISRRDVRPHHMGPLQTQPHAQQHQISSITKHTQSKTKQHSNNHSNGEEVVLLMTSDEDNSDNDDDIDDFAADLEKEIENEKSKKHM